MTRPIVNIDELELREIGNGKFVGRFGAISPRVGARKLGYNLTTIPPGKRAWPFHSHRVNEEMFYVVDGEGELRFGDTRYPVRARDVIGCPPGGPEVAHDVTNTSPTRELRILAVSTQLEPEICDYPDSKKQGVAGSGVRVMFRAGESLDYWEGE